MRKLAITFGAVAVAVAFAASASPALAAFTLNLSAPEPVVVGQPAVLQATGTLDADELEYLFWFSLDAIPTSVTTTCPADHYVGAQFASDTGGSIVVFSQRAVADAAGNFTIPVAIKPTAPGSLLLCGYIDDGLTSTMAAASLILDIKPAAAAPPPPRTRWTTARIRADAIAGIRSCRALLRRPATCERKIIRLANSRCRRLRPELRRTTCLRVVRRVARR